MDTAEKVLDLLFRRIPPERILRRVCDMARGIAKPPRDPDAVFLQFADTTLHGYSQDEQKLFFDQLRLAVDKRARDLHTDPSPFLPLVDFGLECLTAQGGEPLCRSSRVLRWRDAYHLFGQDMIVCAYLAYCDIQAPQAHRKNFAWPAILRTDDNVLQQILSSGIAENHFHLNGSTQSFALAWCALMNDPASIQTLPKEFSCLLQSVASRGPEDNILPIKDRLVIAALVRSILFRALHRADFSTRRNSPCAKNGAGGNGRDLFCSQAEFRTEYLYSFSAVGVLADQIRVIQEAYGVWIPMPSGKTVCLDYTLELPVFQSVKDSPYRVLAGERSFLYQCYTACFEGSFSPFEQYLLYLYLSLKSAFRGEMIQVNRQVGFQNFADYQDRKDLAWSETYRWEACRMALNAPLKVEPVCSLEARLVPAKTRNAMIKKVAAYDLGKRFADQPYQSSGVPNGINLDLERDAGQFLKEPYFYVLHFPKRSDSTPPEKPVFDLTCRHKELRDDVRAEAEAIAEALSTSVYFSGRVRGIDACSNEVNCRPEVFATAFRFLRNFKSTNPSPSPLLSRPAHRLSVTYHAGEDFYDIADGLRAIDEALYFLEYRRGDRIGHALALGVDPQTHYQMKSMCIVLPRQNYLDNLVWLLYRGRDLGVHIDPQQYGVMQQEALRLLKEIYGHAIWQNRWHVTLQDYYCSMMLRGDAPGLYRSMRFQEPSGMYGSQYERWQIAPDRPPQELRAYRLSPEIAGMYYYYHFGQEERLKGAAPISVSIKSGYIAVVRAAQDALQRHLAARGIIIECNPSSNVLIGTFGEYGKHPITRFNSMGLVDPADSHCPQLHVCVNTDDLGVFDTSLAFEYALLYRALSERQNENGSPCYTSKNILNYLCNIQKMGLQAVFPPAQTTP